MNKNYRPTKEDLAAALNKKVDDIIDYNLKILFCGINPGLYTAAVGFHFGRPGNRFWPALHKAGLTPREFHPSEQNELLTLGYGITNVVERTSARADEISKEEYKTGGEILENKICKFRPKILAILGIGAYKIAFDEPKAKIGLQHKQICDTKIWILPNPSGLNANYNLDRIAENLRNLKNYSDHLK